MEVVFIFRILLILIIIFLILIEILLILLIVGFKIFQIKYIKNIVIIVYIIKILSYLGILYFCNKLISGFNIQVSVNVIINGSKVLKVLFKILEIFGKIKIVSMIIKSNNSIFINLKFIFFMF